MYQKIFICINYCYSFVNRSSDKNWNKKTIKKYKNCLIATIETNSESNNDNIQISSYERVACEV